MTHQKKNQDEILKLRSNPQEGKKAETEKKEKENKQKMHKHQDTDNLLKL